VVGVERVHRTEFVAKFAWSRPAALRLRNEIGVLTALPPVVPYLPEVVVSSTDPLLLVTRRVPGTSLFAVADSIDRDQAGRQLARFLTALQHPSARARVEAELGPLSAARRHPPRRPPHPARLGRRPGRPLRHPRPRPLGLEDA
jgi:hypothetical protein